MSALFKLANDLRMWALLANSAYALSSFLLGYLLLLHTDAMQFGLFAFFLMVQSFGYGVFNALFASPLLIASNKTSSLPAGSLKPMLWVSLVISLLLISVQAVVMWYQALPWTGMLWLLTASAWLNLRWFCRCSQQQEAPTTVIVADLLFSFVAVCGGLALLLLQQLSLSTVSALLFVAAMVSAVPSLPLLGRILVAKSEHKVWRHGFQQQGKPALLGVLSAEVSANFHQYFIIAFKGAAALAPLAAAGLFLRPMTLVQTSLAQIDRPKLARAAAVGDRPLFQKIARSMLRLSIFAYLLNLLVVACVLWLAPNWLWQQTTTQFDFIACLIFVAAVSLLRSLRGPASTQLQALDEFHFLAAVTLRSTAVVIPLVLLGYSLFDFYGTLVAMFIGECWIALPILWRCRQQQKSFGKTVDSPRGLH